MGVIKSKEEVEKIRRSCRLVRDVRNRLAEHVRVGITTLELDALAERWIREGGGLPAFKGYRGYRHSICVSVNEQVVHGVPGDRILQEGDLVGLDVGVVMDGYYGDTAVTVSIGRVTKKAERLVRATREALEDGIQHARAGHHLGDISSAIESVGLRYGLGVVRDLYGHGIGTHLHEEPLVPNVGHPGEGLVLQAGMVFAIEPMFNLGSHRVETLPDGWTVVTRDRRLSAHFEHTMVIQEEGPEVLT